MTTHRLWLKRIVGLFLLISLVGYYLLLLSNSQLYRDTFFILVEYMRFDMLFSISNSQIG